MGSQYLAALKEFSSVSRPGPVLQKDGQNKSGSDLSHTDLFGTNKNAETPCMTNAWKFSIIRDQEVNLDGASSLAQIPKEEWISHGTFEGWPTMSNDGLLDFGSKMKDCPDGPDVSWIEITRPEGGPLWPKFLGVRVARLNFVSHSSSTSTSDAESNCKASTCSTDSIRYPKPERISSG
jgi:hypothetical protein